MATQEKIGTRCTFDQHEANDGKECGNKLYAGGLCSTHYRKVRKGFMVDPSGRVETAPPKADAPTATPPVVQAVETSQAPVPKVDQDGGPLLPPQTGDDDAPPAQGHDDEPQLGQAKTVQKYRHMDTDVWVFPVREFGYNGLQRERGEVFELDGLRNDGGLQRHGYVQVLENSTEDKRLLLPRCDECVKMFADDTFLNVHYEGRIHPRSPNYQGPEARYSGEAPPAREEFLGAARQPAGLAPRFN